MAKAAAAPKPAEKKTAEAPVAPPTEATAPPAEASVPAAGDALPATGAEHTAGADQSPPGDQDAPTPLLAVDSLSPAFMAVLAERRRQQGEEGYSAESDDALTDYQLPRAAACYVLAASGVARHKATLFWPFEQPIKVAEDRRRNLIKAAALLLAEIERIDRDAEQA